MYHAPTFQMCIPGLGYTVFLFPNVFHQCLTFYDPGNTKSQIGYRFQAKYRMKFLRNHQAIPRKFIYGYERKANEYRPPAYFVDPISLFFSQGGCFFRVCFGKQEQWKIGDRQEEQRSAGIMNHPDDPGGGRSVHFRRRGEKCDPQRKQASQFPRNGIHGIL